MLVPGDKSQQPRGEIVSKVMTRSTTELKEEKSRARAARNNQKDVNLGLFFCYFSLSFVAVAI